MLRRITMISLPLAIFASVVGCAGKQNNFSLLPTAQGFKQQVINPKIDILWVVDNSASMGPLQNNMTTNFNTFIQQFTANGYDFHLGVTSTDAYRANAKFANNPALAKLSDGVTTQTGVFDILPSTMNLVSTFVTNATLQANGSGDENAFSSLRETLNSPLNAGFLRPDSFLGVIILSDEDDFSDPNRPEFSWLYSGGIPDHDYSNPGLETVDSYVSYMDQLTATTGATRRYSVSAISVLDQTCAATHVKDSPSSIIGQRYMDFANQTSGVLGSVCDASYANSLAAIQNKILELSTQFYLTGSPDVTSLVVTVNGQTIPTGTTDGWTYNATANSVVFHGAAIPPSGADISVTFNPTKLTF